MYGHLKKSRVVGGRLSGGGNRGLKAQKNLINAKRQKVKKGGSSNGKEVAKGRDQDARKSPVYR